MQRRVALSIVTLAIGCLGLAPFGYAAWDDVIAAAKREGAVVMYTTALGAPFHKIIAADFQSKYGISVNILDLRGSEVRERIRIEQVSGRVVGDVVQLSPVSLEDIDAVDRALQPLDSVPNEKNLKPPFERNALSIPSQTYGFGILVNTNLVSAQDEPKSWWDLLEPKWQGKILSDDFRAAGGGQVFFEATYEKLGAEFQEKLATQKLVFSRELGASERRVALGEYPMRIPQHLTTSLALKGLPIKFIAPKEGMTYIQFNSAVIKNAPHPNAALLLINHYLELEAQTLIANAGLAPAVKGAVERADPSVQGIVGATLLGTTRSGNMDKMRALSQQLYK